MMKNMGGTDRMIRIVFAILFSILYFTGVIPGTFGLILFILGIVFLLTSAVSSCPIYKVVGLNTLPKKSNSKKL